MKLSAAMKKADVGDAELGAACKPPLHRTLLWAYRKGKKVPRGDTALAIQAALRARGVEIALEDLVGKRSQRAA